jgi:repressor LexA
MKTSGDVCLTKRQLEILDFLVEFRRKHRVSPTLAEIADHFQISKVTVFEHLRALKRRKAIRLSRRTPRSAAPIVDTEAGRSRAAETAPPVQLDVLGAVAAGSPVESFDAPETFDLDSLVGEPGRRFLLRVTGQSMLDEHIADGDLILVESKATAENGDTVVAMVDGGATVKKFYRDGSRVRLQPANPTLPPLYPESCEIKGVVVGLIRRL